MTNRKGFTLIELLVVIAIIGILSTIAVVALNTARSKSRDAKRIADIKQIQTALELYFNDQDGYPVEAAGVDLGTANAACLDPEGWETSTVGAGANECSATAAYMASVPANPGPDGAAYHYDADDATTYSITFTLVNDTGGLSAGACTATPGSLTCV